MEDDIVYLHKPIGMVLNDCNEYLRNIYFDKKISFAGRLDPMARGIMPFIIRDINGKGDETQQNLQHGYKIYQFCCLSNFKSKSFDILSIADIRENNLDIFEKIKELEKIKVQSYPSCSTKTINVDGKRKRLWELSGEVPNIEHKVDVKYIIVLSIDYVSGIEIKKMISERLNKLSKNFKIDNGKLTINDIINNWNNIIDDDEHYEILKCEANVSSGTYIRGLVDDMGGVCFDICRIEMNGVKIDSDNYDKYDLKIIKN